MSPIEGKKPLCPWLGSWGKKGFSYLEMLQNALLLWEVLDDERKRRQGTVRNWSGQERWLMGEKARGRKTTIERGRFCIGVSVGCRRGIWRESSFQRSWPGSKGIEKGRQKEKSPTKNI